MSAAKLAQALISAVASAGESDAERVRARLKLFPEAILANLQSKGMGVVVCHGSVTDYRPGLATEMPRGWPPGINWSVVPGCYLPDEHKVVIATIERGGIWQVPPTGVLHGSFDLVLHEVMHADDYSGGQLRSHNPDFMQAREADKAALNEYQRQDGAAGLEESYAETAARLFGADPSFAPGCPRLAAFWDSAALPVEPGRRERAAHGKDFIGVAHFLDDGAIELDLRGDNDGRAVGGHALIRAEPGSAIYNLIGERRRRSARPQERTILLEAF
jgi:hypothetical protein